MTEIKLENSIEAKRLLDETLRAQADKIENPALKRIAEESIDPEKFAYQAYDRMYHTHNRS